MIGLRTVNNHAEIRIADFGCGHIDLQSKVGVGSTFSVYLPYTVVEDPED